MFCLNASSPLALNVEVLVSRRRLTPVVGGGYRLGALFCIAMNYSAQKAYYSAVMVRCVHNGDQGSDINKRRFEDGYCYFSDRDVVFQLIGIFYSVME
jgi:hypothetical protein